MQALRTALELKKCALLMEPRTGKTKVSIDYLSALSLAGKLDRAVIVAPARVLDVWVEEFRAHCPVSYHLHIWDAKARKQPIPAVRSVYDLSVLLVNYDAFYRNGDPLPSGKGYSKKTGRWAYRRQIEKWVDGHPAAMILDESHKIKSASGRASVMLVGMRAMFDYRLILTGTPITKAKRAFDIYMQWRFLNPDRFKDLPDSESFKQRYGVWRTAMGTHSPYPEFKRLQNESELTERIYADSFRVTRAECFDLPDRSSRIIDVPLSVRTAEAYDELAEKMVARIEHEEREHTVTAPLAITMLLKLAQITGGFVKDENGSTLPVGTEKLDALDALFEETIENDEKMVVVARFKGELDAITTLAKKRHLPVFEVRGGISRETVTGNIRGFRVSDSAAVLVMQPQAGGVGIDLSTAAHMVWYSLTPSWVDYTQACDRIALSKKATTYTYLLAEKTVDHVLFETRRAPAKVR
ncbi:MAG: DEAD/DEAH box helicase [Actinobacteria bacterium]|nr:DEAD/DEAH box helicase [Actinomycetota bacterium]